MRDESIKLCTRGFYRVSQFARQIIVKAFFFILYQIKIIMQEKKSKPKIESEKLYIYSYKLIDRLLRRAKHKYIYIRVTIANLKVNVRSLLRLWDTRLMVSSCCLREVAHLFVAEYADWPCFASPTQGLHNQIRSTVC